MQQEGQRFDELVRRLAEDDLTAAEPLLREFGPSVRGGLKRRYGLQEADVEDILQDILFNLWRSRHTYDPNKGSPLSWFRTIAYHATMEWFRENLSRWQDRTLAFDPLDPQDDTVLTPKLRVLLEILCGLGEEDRTIVLDRQRDVPFGEIAKKVGKTEGAVRTQYHRLLKTIGDDMQSRERLLPELLTIDSEKGDDHVE